MMNRVLLQCVSDQIVQLDRTKSTCTKEKVVFVFIRVLEREYEYNLYACGTIVPAANNYDG